VGILSSRGIRRTTPRIRGIVRWRPRNPETSPGSGSGRRGCGRISWRRSAGCRLQPRGRLRSTGLRWVGVTRRRCILRGRSISRRRRILSRQPQLEGVQWLVPLDPQEWNQQEYAANTRSSVELFVARDQSSGRLVSWKFQANRRRTADDLGVGHRVGRRAGRLAVEIEPGTRWDTLDDGGAGAGGEAQHDRSDCRTNPSRRRVSHGGAIVSGKDRDRKDPAFPRGFARAGSM
jgi:hypothetical protein